MHVVEGSVKEEPLAVEYIGRPTRLRDMRPAMLVLVVVLSGIGCSSNRASIPASNYALTPCTEPRPEICTREYIPVCGQRENGEWKTYSTACTACSDTRVLGYKPEACK